MITIQVDTADQKILPQVLPPHREWLLSNIRGAGGRLEPVPSDADSATKGSADLFSLFIPAASVPAIVQIIKLWLKERGRAITVQVIEDGDTTTYRLVGAVSDVTVREILSHAMVQDRTQDDAGR
jgi:hypothetical protein